jgi:nicotinamidase/pyrazinamidase
MAHAQAALLIVDVQVDFCPGAALGVKDGDQVVPLINRYSQRFRAAGLPIFASRDWHPQRSAHFAGFGGPWPVHCVQGTPGAAFHPDLVVLDAANIISKGTDLVDDGYSAFEGTFVDGSTLEERLTCDDVGQLCVAGLATDYCVRSSVLDARKLGLRVILLVDAIRGVEVHFGDSARALEEMSNAGLETATLETLQLG